MKNTQRTAIPIGSAFQSMTWCNISVSVHQKVSSICGSPKLDEEKKLLDEVSGYAQSGEILALMGASGSGKTILLNTLMGIAEKEHVMTGCVKINEEVVECSDIRRISAYVRQRDLFVGALTVHEQLLFSARLRMGRSISREVQKERVNEVMVELGLVKCAKTLIGTPNTIKGISGGEMKRLAFACEILTDPSILLCDEPTSGLDAFMAVQVMNCLRNIAAKGKAIIISIHQPSNQIFNMFTNVCVLSTGRIVYYGPVSAVCDFWEKMGIACPRTYNPADHMIRSLSIGGNVELSAERVSMIRKHFKESEHFKRLQERIQVEATLDAPNRLELKKCSKYQSTKLIQIQVLFIRSFLITIRDPTLLKVKIVQIIATSIIIGIVNLRTEVTGPTIMNLEGILYNTVRDMNFMFLFPSVYAITSELPLFMREHRSGIYAVETYYIAKSLAEIPNYTVLPIIYSIIVYFLSGLYLDARAFFVYCAVTIFITYVAVSIAYAGACVFADDNLAITYMPCFILPMLVFGGFYVSFHSIPSYFQWLSYLSWFRYGFEALQINQWQHIETIAGCSDTNITQMISCPGSNGTDLLTRRGMGTTDLNIFLNVSILIMMFFFFRILGFLALSIRARRQK